MPEKEEQKKMCPLSIVFNMGQLAPGALSTTHHVFAYCAKEKCQWWMDYFLYEEHYHNCALVAMVEKMGQRL